MTKYEKFIGEKTGGLLIIGITKRKYEYLFVVKCDCGNQTEIICRDFFKRKNYYCGKCINGKSLEDFKGDKYGSYTILSLVSNNKGRKYCDVICDCGKIRKKLSFDVVKKHNVDSCKYCIHGIPLEDFVGKKYGSLTIQKSYYKDNSKYCLVKCDCGKQIEVKFGALTSGKKTTCGKCHRKYIVKNPEERNEKRKKTLINKFLEQNMGKKFGRLTIVGAELTSRHMGVKCVCECGNNTTVAYYDLKTGRTSSCGCLHKELLSKNGAKYNKNNHHNYNWYFILNDNKIFCRSGFEVLYANYLINNNIDFLYEPDTLITMNNSHYTPDFKLISTNEYIEIKGHIFSDLQQEKIHFLQKNGYKIKQIEWEELRKLCDLKFKSYNSYFKKAKKLGVPINQFFAEQNYKSII